MKYNIIHKERVYNGFFKIDKYTVTHDTFDNQEAIEKKIEVFERGDSCAVLLYEKDTNSLLFTSQFRLPTANNDSGWILELVAGKVEENEKPINTMKREIEEEIGYSIESLTSINYFYVSPGGTSERVFLFYSETSRIHQTMTGGGKYEEGEDIKLIRIPVEEIEDRLNEIIDAKTLIGIQWFLLNRKNL